MHFGLTYDLREDYLRLGFSEEQTAEFDSPETVEALADALRAAGHTATRIGNVHHLVTRLAAGDTWELVFNIAEGLYGFGREAQVPALLDAYGIPYVFSDPLVLALALHKGMAKRVARDAGVPTPDFAVVSTPAEAAEVRLPFPLFVKPVAEGTSKGISASSRVDDAPALRRSCERLLARYAQPVLVETYLPGDEFTVGILGTGADAAVLGVLEVGLRPEAEAGIYSYHNKEHYADLVDYRLAGGPAVAGVERVALAAWRALGCRDGGRVDVRLDAAGRPHFLEVNPLAGLHPVRSDLVILARLKGMTHAELIAAILGHALTRLGLAPAGARRGARPRETRHAS